MERCSKSIYARFIAFENETNFIKSKSNKIDIKMKNILAIPSCPQYKLLYLDNAKVYFLKKFIFLNENYYL